jgi:hypothetical protein
MFTNFDVWGYNQPTGEQVIEGIHLLERHEGAPPRTLHGPASEVMLVDLKPERSRLAPGR